MGIYIEKQYQKTPLGAVVEDSMTSGSKVNAPSINAVQSAFSNPNLLINGGFQVNQRNKTTYTSDNQTRFYTIDRWRAYGTGNSTIVKNSDGTVTITSLGELWVVQPFEETLKEDDYTISCEVVSVTGNVKMWFEGDDDSVYNKSLVVGVNTYTRKVSPQGATFGLIGNGASVTLKWVKLEQGSIATPFVPRPYAEELAMCQRYYIYLDNVIGTRTQTLSDIACEIRINLPVPMRTAPSLYDIGVGMYRAQSTGQNASTVEIQTITSQSVQMFVYFPNVLFNGSNGAWIWGRADAEIY